MRSKIFTLLVLLSLAPALFYAQKAGDIAFTGFNADGNDNFAIVTFVDLAPNTTIWFRDSEWNGTMLGSDEGSVQWNSGETVIPAGTVISFDNTGGGFIQSASAGTLINPNISLSGSGEGIFAYLGPALDTPTVFLAAIANADEATGFGSLANTGLTAGSTAILLPAGIDVAAYTGPRTGLDQAGYLAALNDIANNWVTQDGTGDQHVDGTAPDLPFSLTPFTFSMGGDMTPPSVISVNIISATQWSVSFNETLETGTGVNSATNTANYAITPNTLTISSLLYDANTNSVALNLSGMQDGVDYLLSISNIADTAGNIMAAAYQSLRLVFNSTEPVLLFTEINYNPCGEQDSLEFVEIINAGDQPAILGGLRVRDVNPGSGAFGQLNVVLPSQTLAPGDLILIAPNGKGASNFYNKDFIDGAFIGNALGNGGEALTIKNSLGLLLDSVNYDDAAPWPTAADGTGPSLERKSLEAGSSDPTNWKASTNPDGAVGSAACFSSPGVFTESIASSVSFQATHSIFEEGDTEAFINLVIDQAPEQDVIISIETVDLTAMVGPNTDILLSSTSLSFKKDSTSPVRVQIFAEDNDETQPDRYFAIRIKQVQNGILGEIKEHLVYIKDNDQPEITPNREIQLDYAGSYAVGTDASAEIVAYDAASKRLFVVNSTQNKLEILGFDGPAKVMAIKTIDMGAYGQGITSVAAFSGIVAASVDAPDFKNGKAVFFDIDGNLKAQVEVGNLPDMITFTADGKRVLTANEGQPNADYSIDPEGSVSVIDLPANIEDLKQTDVTTITFNDFDGDLDVLRDSGIRIYGPDATVSQDLEPEYITVSLDGNTAWVSLQENNAIAIIDLVNLKVVNIVALGYKDHTEPENALDASDQSGVVLMSNYPVWGMYQPDAIASFSVEGTTYIVSANEGDAREYDALEEAVRFGSSAFPLDSLAFPNGDILKKNQALGRLNVTNAYGDFDEDGDFDAAYVYGGRSFSIWDANGNLVYDSGDQLERITATDPDWSSLFNASNSNNNFKNRSDDKGPEPEGVITARLNGNVYAFIALERIGGIMVFNVTVPSEPTFVQYVNSRDLGADEGGDLGPEGLLFLSPDASPTDTAMVVVANEVSGTLSFYHVNGVLTPTKNVVQQIQEMVAFPNPASNMIFVEKTDDYTLWDLSGKLVRSIQQENFIPVNDLPAGMYLLQRKDGAVARISVQK